MPNRATHWKGPLLLSAEALLRPTRVADDAPATFLNFDSPRSGFFDDFQFVGGVLGNPGTADGWTLTDIGAAATTRGVQQATAVGLPGRTGGVLHLEAGTTASTGVNAAYIGHAPLGWIATGTSINALIINRITAVDSGSASVFAFGYATAASVWLENTAGGLNLGANTGIGWRVDASRNLNAVTSASQVDTGVDLTISSTSAGVTWYDLAVHISRTSAQAAQNATATWYYRRSNSTGWIVARAATAITTMPTTAVNLVPHVSAWNGAAGTIDVYCDGLGHLGDRGSN